MDLNFVLVLLVIMLLCLVDNLVIVLMIKIYIWSGNFEGYFIFFIIYGDLIGWEVIIIFNVLVIDI